jgi:hypothetical protein
MELYKYASSELQLRFHRFINHNCTPKEWRTALVMTTFRKGNSAVCTNYRDTSRSLLNPPYKIYANILTWRVNAIAETLLLEAQSGFRKTSSCKDGVVITKTVSREKNRIQSSNTSIICGLRKIIRLRIKKQTLENNENQSSPSSTDKNVWNLTQYPEPLQSSRSTLHVINGPNTIATDWATSTFVVTATLMKLLTISLL